MAVAPKKPRFPDEKCKASNDPAPADFERPWHGPFLTDALRSADIPGALLRAEVGWGDYLRSRRDHPAFLVACQELDLVIRTALYTRLEALAASGDPKAAKLLNGGLNEIRRTLTDAGVDPLGPRGTPSNQVPDLHQVGPFGVPAGPCACCARGLMIHLMDDAGRMTHVLVRHEVMRDQSVVPYLDTSPNLKIVYGFVPGNPGDVVRYWELGTGPGRIDPDFCVGPLTGPTMAEIWCEYIRLHPERRHGSGFDILDAELAPGEEPSPTVAHRYRPDVDLAGRRIFRLKPGDNGEINIDGK